MKSIEKSPPKVESRQTVSPVPWNPWLGVIFILLLYFASQFFGGIIVSLYPLLKHWSDVQANNWLNNSVAAQFIYILLAESFVIGGISLSLKKYKLGFKIIGLRRPRWKDPLYGLAMAPVYYIVYVIVIGVLSQSIHGFNVTQQQDIGFTTAHGVAQLIMTFISLVILPPLTEEIMVRGFLYSSLRKGLQILPAALVTSVIFASAHLPEGGSSGLLWVGFVDTFILSLALVYLREKTGGLWASMTLHALKNGVAFLALFVFVSH
jgi:CAAX protease family protein